MVNTLHSRVNPEKDEQVTHIHTPTENNTPDIDTHTHTRTRQEQHPKPVNRMTSSCPLYRRSGCGGRHGGGVTCSRLKCMCVYIYIYIHIYVYININVYIYKDIFLPTLQEE